MTRHMGRPAGRSAGNRMGTGARQRLTPDERLQVAALRDDPDVWVNHVLVKLRLARIILMAAAAMTFTFLLATLYYIVTGQFWPYVVAATAGQALAGLTLWRVQISRP